MQPSLTLRHPTRRLRATRAAGVEPSAPGGRVGSVYDGAYGRWTLKPSDLVEVWAYRGALGAAATSFAAAVATSAAGAPLPPAAGTAVALVTAGSMVAVTSLIHVYVTPIKRTMQTLALAGAAGVVAVATTHGDVGVPAAVAADSSLVWLVGPSAAAVTGVAIKEGLCYGKREAAALAAMLPVACLAHLSGFVPAPASTAAAVAAATCGLAFASTKLTQAPVEDIGDKSVFEFRGLPAEEQAARLAVVAKRAAFLEDA